MIALIDHPIETLKRKATILILQFMAFWGVLATILHWIAPKTHPISLVIPPLTVIICLGLLLYLLKWPHAYQRVTKLLLAWSTFIVIFPEYLGYGSPIR